jgi:hypothetical protein
VPLPDRASSSHCGGIGDSIWHARNRSISNANTDGTADIFFTACITATAPSAPVCGSPTAVAQVAHPLSPSINISAPMLNINLEDFNFPKHAHGKNAGDSFTTFLTYEDYRSPFPNGPCLDAEVMMVASADNGNTWTTPASVDTTHGHHFFAAISADASTVVVNLSSMSAAGDKYSHEVEVWRNQIVPGATAVGTPQQVFSTLDPIDSNPKGLGLLQSDLYMGIKPPLHILRLHVYHRLIQRTAG